MYKNREEERHGDKYVSVMLGKDVERVVHSSMWSLPFDY